VTIALLVFIAVVQMMFAALLTVFIFVHRRHAERRARAEAEGVAQLAVPVREWLVGEGSLESIRTALDALPPATARYTALNIGRKNLAVEVRQQFAELIRDRPWVREGLLQIESPWWWRRLEAARLLADLGTNADEHYVRRLLADPHPAVRAAATSCLRRVATSAVIEVVLDNLPSQPVVVQNYQLMLLREQWQLTREAVLPRLEPSTEPDRLAQWVTVAEALETPDVLAKVVPLHTHDAAPVRIAVARAMKKYFHPDSVRILLVMIQDGDWRVRSQAARSLGVLRDGVAVEPLAARLLDTAWWVRFRSALALTQLGEPGRAALREARSSPDKFAANIATLVGGLSPGSVIELVEG